MICLEDFEVNHMFFTISFQKDKEYSSFEINGEKYISIGLFNIPLEKVRDKFRRNKYEL